MKWVHCDNDGCQTKIMVDEVNTDPGIHVREERPVGPIGDANRELDFCSWRCVAQFAGTQVEPVLVGRVEGTG